jgi:hypothetical protein
MYPLGNPGMATGVKLTSLIGVLSKVEPPSVEMPRYLLVSNPLPSIA